MHGQHDSATTPQAARHRIKSLEAAGDSAAARAQTVWARPLTSLPTSRTRWRRPACISPMPIVDAASDREGAERQRSAARDQGPFHAARLYRESAASPGSASSETPSSLRCSFDSSVSIRIIRRARGSLTSRWRGTGWETPVTGLRYQSCLPPCLTNTQPLASITLIRSRRFMA